MDKCVKGGTKQLRQQCRHARECNPREEPDALTRTSGSVRGARGNSGPYRCARHDEQLEGESPLSSQMAAKD